MNIKIIALGLAVCCAGFAPHRVKADPKPVSSSLTGTAWVAAEKDVCGDWMDRDGRYWEVVFEPDHTLKAYQGAVGYAGPHISTWKLVNNHVIITDMPTVGKYGFGANWGNDFLVMNVKGHIVLLPVQNLPVVQQYGLASFLCLWRSTKSGLDDLVDGKIDTPKIRKIMGQVEYNRSK